MRQSQVWSACYRASLVHQAFLPREKNEALCVRAAWPLPDPDMRLRWERKTIRGA